MQSPLVNEVVDKCIRAVVTSSVKLKTGQIGHLADDLDRVRGLVNMESDVLEELRNTVASCTHENEMLRAENEKLKKKLAIAYARTEAGLDNFDAALERVELVSRNVRYKDLIEAQTEEIEELKKELAVAKVVTIHNLEVENAKLEKKFIAIGKRTGGLCFFDQIAEISKLKARNMYLEHTVTMGCNGCDKAKETTGLREVIEKQNTENNDLSNECDELSEENKRLKDQLVEACKDQSFLKHRVEELEVTIGRCCNGQTRDSRLVILERYRKAWEAVMECCPTAKRMYEWILAQKEDG